MSHTLYLQLTGDKCSQVFDAIVSVCFLMDNSLNHSDDILNINSNQIHAYNQADKYRFIVHSLVTETQPCLCVCVFLQCRDRRECAWRRCLYCPEWLW